MGEVFAAFFIVLILAIVVWLFRSHSTEETTEPTAPEIDTVQRQLLLPVPSIILCRFTSCSWFRF